MKKLLFIIEHLNAGGAERSLVDILKHLDYAKYDVDLLLVQDAGDYQKEIPKEVNIILYSLNDAFGSFGKCILRAIRKRDWFSMCFRLIYYFSSKTRWDNLKYTKKLFKKVEDYYDCIIACRQSFICNELAAFVFNGYRKLSWWHHGELTLNNYGINRLKSAYKSMDDIITVSTSSAEIVIGGFGINRDRVKVIPNMICIDRIKIFSEKFNVDYKKKLIISSLGRFSPEKNMLLCPETGLVLKNSGVDFVWYMIGDGEELNAVKNKTSKLGLEDNFIFTERLDNPYPYIRVSDVFVHTSLVESQGIAILESMVLHTPVVVVESEGPKEYIVNGHNGYLVGNDAEQISDAIINIINNANKCKELIKNAFETTKLFSPGNTINLFNEIVNK